MTKFRIVLMVAAMTAAIMWGTADAATLATYSKECQSWAHMISAGEDDARMHMIGCDDGAEANGLYARSDGECSALARHIWRENHNLHTIVNDVKDIDATCTIYEDGSWSR